MQLRSSRKNKAFLCQDQGINSNWKNLDQSSLLIISIFLSLASFALRQPYILYQYISSFRWLQYIKSFFLQFVGCWSFVLGVEMRHLQKRRGRNLPEAPTIILTAQDCLFVPSSISLTSLQTEEAFTLREYKHTLTHTATAGFSISCGICTFDSFAGFYTLCIDPSGILRIVSTFLSSKHSFCFFY